jgi:hypothetical protein
MSFQSLGGQKWEKNTFHTHGNQWKFTLSSKMKQSYAIIEMDEKSNYHLNF